MKYNRWTVEIDPNAGDALVELAGQIQKTPIHELRLK
jgi:hypothetical protein